MSAEPRYYYVDAQNQAAGPIAMAGLLALKAAGTVSDATLVVLEGGTEWVAFSTLKPAGATPTGAAAALHSPAPVGGRSEGGSAAPQASPPTPQPATTQTSPSSPSTSGEPLWASNLSKKIDELISSMDKLAIAVQKSRPSSMPVMAPATASLHAEKISLNPTPKPGIASLNPSPTSPAQPPLSPPASRSPPQNPPPFPPLLPAPA